MWTCKHCENQNEENFNFCWSCGKPRSFKNETAQEINTDIPLSKPSDLELERNASQVGEIMQPKKQERPPKVARKSPEMVIIQPIRHEPQKQKEKKAEKKAENLKEPEKMKTKIPEPELFSTFLPESERGKTSTDSETDWGTVIFKTAVRLVGLYFIFLVLTSIPDFIALVYSFFLTENVQITGFSDLWTIPLFIFAAKLLFYLILGIYLIASGRFLIWLLPSAYSE